MIITIAHLYFHLGVQIRVGGLLARRTFVVHGMIEEAAIPPGVVSYFAELGGIRVDARTGGRV